MKNILFALLFFGSISFGFSQELSYGLKGGLNYAMGGEITGNNSGLPHLYTSNTFEAEGKLGYHGGAFVQVNFGKFFIRPEITYSSLKTSFDFPQLTSAYSVEKFDVPFLLGYNVYGPVDVFLGPIYSNIINSQLEGNNRADPIVVQESPINLQAGFNVDLGSRFEIDVRYERTLSPAKPQPEILDFDVDGFPLAINNAHFDEASVHQIIVGVAIKLGGPGLNERKRRACY